MIEWFQKKERLAESISLKLTKEEKKMVGTLAAFECNSENGAIRKAIVTYYKSIAKQLN